MKKSHSVRISKLRPVKLFPSEFWNVVELAKQLPPGTDGLNMIQKWVTENKAEFMKIVKTKEYIKFCSSEWSKAVLQNERRAKRK